MKNLILSVLLLATSAFSQSIILGYAPVVVTASPVPDIFWAKFNDNSGTAFTDSSGHGYNGTINRAGQWEPGKGGFAITNNGSADFARTTGNIVYSTNKITVCFWIWLTAGQHATTEIWAESSAIWSGTSGTFLAFDTGDNTTVSLAMNMAASTSSNVKTFPLPGNGAWHHVLIVFDSSTTGGAFTVYVDKVLQTLSGGSGSVAGAVNFASQPLFMAARNASSLWAVAALDDFRIYSGDQSASVTAIFNDPQ